MTEPSPADIFIVDNSHDRFKVLDYLGGADFAMPTLIPERTAEA